MNTEQIVTGAFYNFQLAILFISATILFTVLIEAMPYITKGVKMWVKRFKKSYKIDNVLSLLQSSKPKIEYIARNTMELKGVKVSIVEVDNRSLRITIDGESKDTNRNKSVVYGFIKLDSNNNSFDNKLWISVWLNLNNSVCVEDFNYLLKQIELLITGEKK